MEQEKMDQLDKLAQRLENTNIAEFVKMSQQPCRVLWMNFLSGIARGLGFTVGTAVVLGIAYKFISHVISMNIPYLTEALTDLISFIKDAP